MITSLCTVIRHHLLVMREHRLPNQGYHVLPDLASLVPRFLLGAALSVAACERGPRLEIIEPRRGEVVAGDRVTIRWRLAGAAPSPGSHYHVFLDRDLPAVGDPIPMGDPNIVHLPAGSVAEHSFHGLEPGPHRITVVLGDAAHRAQGGIYRASVTFRARGP